MIYKRDGSAYWYYGFMWRGKRYQGSTKLKNKNAATTWESAKRTALANGLVGILERKPAPKLSVFIDRDVLPYVRTKYVKPRTVQFFEYHARVIKANAMLSRLPLDQIGEREITAHITARQADGMKLSTCNRDLAFLRYCFKQAERSGLITKRPSIIIRTKDETRRDRVVTPAEEKAYLALAAPLLKDVATLLFELGLRPEEAYRLAPANVRDDNVYILTGKGTGSRRRVPCSEAALEVLNRRIELAKKERKEFLFSAPTKSGHIDHSSLKKQHAAALKASQVPRFVLYDIRHTAITRWSERVDSFTLAAVAGHRDSATTKRYVHSSEQAARGILTVVKTEATTKLNRAKPAKKQTDRKMLKAR